MQADATEKEQGQGAAARGKGAKRATKPAGTMTPHSVYGSDVDQLYTPRTRECRASLRNARTYLPPTVTEFHDRLIERFVASSKLRHPSAR